MFNNPRKFKKKPEIKAEKKKKDPIGEVWQKYEDFEKLEKKYDIIPDLDEDEEFKGSNKGPLFKVLSLDQADQADAFREHVKECS